MSEEDDQRTVRPPWLGMVCFAGVVFLLRMAYLIWLCPYDLAADEAQYWDWSRRLDVSYYSKGPAVAWLIAPCVKWFGIVEWAVRIPAAVAASVSLLILGVFATSASGNNPRAGWFAMFLFCLCPVFHGTGQFMTTDGPYYACWLAVGYAGWNMARTGRISPGRFFLLGALTGVGMLCKYTILLILPGILMFVFNRCPLSRGRKWGSVLAVLGGVMLGCLPIVIWNLQHGWPTLAHLMGSMRLPGGDMTPSEDWNYNPLWTLSYPFYAFALLGPPVALLLIRAVRMAYGTVPAGAGHPSPLREITSYAIHTGAPVFIMYLLVSLRTDVKLNWPTAAYLVALVPVACLLAGEVPPGRGVRTLWKWAIGVGIAAILLISMAPPVLRAVGKLKVNNRSLNTERALMRISGFDRFARSVERAAGEMARETGQEPFYVASTYGRTALLAFYMTNHPVVYCANSYRGGRESSYDYFPDTDLADPKLIGRPAILFDHDQWSWEKALYFQIIERTRFYGRVYRAYEYRGPCREPHMR